VRGFNSSVLDGIEVPVVGLSGVAGREEGCKCGGDKE
jgi:hypothetical protein